MTTKTPTKKARVPRVLKKKTYRQLTELQWRKIRNEYQSNPDITLEKLCKLHDIKYSTAKSRKQKEQWQKNKDENGDEIKPTRKQITMRGKPSIYDPKYCKEIIQFFENKEPYREVEVAGGRIQIVPEKLPSLARFASNIGTIQQVLWQWATERDENGEIIRPDFAEAYAIAKGIQESIIVEGSMAGAYNPVISQLLLKNWSYYQPLVSPPADHSKSKDDEDDLNNIYEAVLEDAKNAQSEIKNRFQKLVGGDIAEGDYQDIKDDD
jgi:hypothetical protein